MMLLQTAEGQGGLKLGFYSSSCPNAEAIVRSTVKYYYDNDPTIAAGVLRLFFHDCFVEGCDGSVLIEGSSAERNALANRGARGFEVIEYAKSQIEASCPRVVSCADILALAARDSVDLSNGPSWNVPLGRRDGRISLASHVNLPSPLDSVAVQRQKFADKGLDDQDLVTLVAGVSAGAHTIGQTHCRFSSYRLYNFTKTGNADPTISPSFLQRFQNICPVNGDGSRPVDLDIDSQLKFDVSFFKNVRDGNAVLESDQRLWGDSVTQKIVNNYAGNFRGLLGVRFAHEFKKAMIKMSGIEVKTGTEGEIRQICSRFNY
uniref:Peroxidase n=1 Tax=Daucus carota subsp. sativus TaxID=79200 RepID=A0A162A397_DAUCS